MDIQVVPAEVQQVSELGRICFEAFKEVQEGRQFPLDWPSIAVARNALGMLV